MVQEVIVTVPRGWALSFTHYSLQGTVPPGSSCKVYLEKVEGLSSFYWILREPFVAFCFILSAVFLLPEGSTITIYFSP